MPHVSPITCVDHHAASGLLVTGGYDGRVVAWNADGTERWCTQFDDLVNDVRVDAGGEAVAVAAADAYAFVLDTATGAHTAALGPHGDDVNVVRWLPSGGLVCTMDHVDPTVRVWTPGDGGWSGRELARHDSGVFGAAVSPDGGRVATAAEDRTAKVWDVASGALLATFHHPGDPETIDWSPDGTVIATGCDDDICRLWNPETGEVVRELRDATAAVRFVRFSDGGARLLVGAYDATMRSYDTATWSVTDEYRLPIQWERAACVAGDRVVIGSFGAAPVFHPHDAATVVPPTFGINAIAAAGDHLLVGRDDGSVLDPRDGTVIARHESIVNTVAISPDRRLAASADYRGVLHLTALAAGGPTHDGDANGGSRRVDIGRGGPINSAVFDAAGDTVFTAGYDGHIRRWSLDGECLDDWAAHHSPIKSLAWSAADGGTLVAGSSDGTLSAWRGRAERWRAGADDLVLVNSVAVADAAGEVVSASRDLHVRRWDVATGALIERLPMVHKKSVKAVAVSADGSRIVSGAYDGFGVLWQRDARGRWAWRVLRLHGKPGVPAVAAGEGAVLTAGWDGSVGHWSADGALVAHLLADARPR